MILWFDKKIMIYFNDYSGLNEWNKTCVHRVGFYTIPYDSDTWYWGGTSICIWMAALVRESTPRSLYVHTDSCECIYDTSIYEVVDILRRNSPYYVAYTHTWILEPVVRSGDDRLSSLTPATSFEWVAPFSWDIVPPNTMAHDNHFDCDWLFVDSNILTPISTYFSLPFISFVQFISLAFQEILKVSNPT